MELLTKEEIESSSAEDLTKRYNTLAKIIGYRSQRETFKKQTTAVYRYKAAQNKYITYRS